MEITLETRLTRAEGILATELDDEVVLMSIERGAYYGVDKTARRIWDLLEVPQTVAELCTRLQEEFEVDDETCRRDVLAFVGLLHAEGLVLAG
jgi:hypothetical protein